MAAVVKREFCIFQCKNCVIGIIINNNVVTILTHKVVCENLTYPIIFKTIAPAYNRILNIISRLA